MSQRLLRLERANHAWVRELLFREDEEWRRRLRWERGELTDETVRLAGSSLLPGWILIQDRAPVGKVLLGAQGGTRILEFA